MELFFSIAGFIMGLAGLYVGIWDLLVDLHDRRIDIDDFNHDNPQSSGKHDLKRGFYERISKKNRKCNKQWVKEDIRE